MNLPQLIAEFNEALFDTDRDRGLRLVRAALAEGITGLELNEQLQAIYPTLKAIISGGCSAEFAAAGLPNRAGVVYLQKPYTGEDVG